MMHTLLSAKTNQSLIDVFCFFVIKNKHYDVVLLALVSQLFLYLIESNQ